jgi:hypothetical protein
MSYMHIMGMITKFLLEGMNYMIKGSQGLRKHRALCSCLWCNIESEIRLGMRNNINYMILPAPLPRSPSQPSTTLRTG